MAEISAQAAPTSALEPQVQEGDWQQALEAGYLYQAQTHYLQQPTPDAEVRTAFDTLARMRGNLRAKYWQKSYNVIQKRLTSPDIVDWQQLETDITQLKAADDALEQRQPERALELLQAVPSGLLSAERYTLEGTAYILQNHPEKAKVAFEAALARDPKHFRAITNMGNLSLEAGDTDAAIALYEQALRIDDTFANALHNLGVAQRRKGNIAASVRYLRKAQQALRKADSEEARGSLSGRARGQRLLQLQRWLWLGVAALVILMVLARRGT